MQPRSQFSSNAQLKPCSLRASSAQAFSPRSLSSTVLKSSTAQLRPCSPGASSAQMLNSGHVDKKSIQFIQNSAKSASRGESGEIKNEYSLRKKLHMSWVRSPTKKNKKKKKKTNKQASEDMCWRSDIRGRSRG